MRRCWSPMFTAFVDYPVWLFCCWVIQRLIHSVPNASICWSRCWLYTTHFWLIMILDLVYKILFRILNRIVDRCVLRGPFIILSASSIYLHNIWVVVFSHSLNFSFNFFFKSLSKISLHMFQTRFHSFFTFILRYEYIVRI